MSLLKFSQTDLQAKTRPFLTVRFRLDAAPAALPEGAWRISDQYLYVDIANADMLHWFVVTNLAAKEARLELEQMSMFEHPTRAYRD